MERHEYDVIIVGLGPAGASLAYFLRDKGLRVAGVDLVDWNGVWGKPCGDAIGEHHFDETGLPKPTGKAMRNRVVGIDVYSPKEDVRLRVKGYGYIIDRREYGTSLIKEAQAKGVDVYLETLIRNPIINNGKLVGVRGRKKNGEEIEFYGKVIVDATGTSSVIRRRLPRDWPVNEKLDPKDTNIAYRRIVDLDHEIEDYQYIRIYVNMSIAPGGYWWFFPEGPTSVNVGLGVQGGMGYPNPKKIFEEKLAKRRELQGVIRVKADAGAMVPTRRPANTLVWDNFIGIGDNGFTVNPIHGGGMGYAFAAAKYASEAIVEAFEANDFTRYGPLWKTNLKYMSGIGAKQAALDIFRLFLQRLTDEEIEWGLKTGIVGAEDAYTISSDGTLRANLGLLDKARMLMRLLGRPSMLLKLRLVGDYMNRIKELYKEYPSSPDGLTDWVDRVKELYREYVAKLER